MCKSVRTGNYLYLCVNLCLEKTTLELYYSDFKMVPRFMFTKIPGAFSGKSLVLEFAVRSSLEYPAYITFYSSDKT